MLVGRPETRSRLVLHVSPVHDPGMESRKSRIATLVLAVDPADRAGIDPVRVGKALGLTRAESRVAVSLAEGKTIDDIARGVRAGAGPPSSGISGTSTPSSASPARSNWHIWSRRWPTSRGCGAESVQGGAAAHVPRARMTPP